MKHIKPFKSIQESFDALDNGGHFYNLFTRANDGKITMAEVTKATEEWEDDQLKILKLDFLMLHFTEVQKSELISHFNENLLEAYREYKSLYPTDFKALMQRIPKSQNLIVRGTPHDSGDMATTMGIIALPLVVGDMSGLTAIPVEEYYHLYHIGETHKLMIGISKNGDKITEGEHYFGGIMKQTEPDEKEESQWFLEVHYFTEV